MRTIVIIPGDGIGPEITDATVEMLKSLNLPIDFEYHTMGANALEATGELIPQETIDAIAKYEIALKGPVTTPIGGGFRSVNVTLRRHFDLFANIRPIRGFGKVPRRYDKVDLIIFRENTEDLYAGIEEQISEDEAHSIKVITAKGSRRIAKAAFEYALAHNKEKVTVVTKANIMKLTDGLFLESARKVAIQYPGIALEEILVDHMAMELVLDPSKYGIILTENLYGDILSDLGAGLIGGLGLAPGANMGKDVAVFEAVHGSAPDIAGKDLANPTALFLSAAMLLDHMKYYKEAQAITTCCNLVLSQPSNFTRDLGGKLGTKEYTKIFIKRLREVLNA
ncbi:MAG: NAD-dependent isocitrate dehydrogenase [Tissierellia bacterium]|nr:NAD-dependent isocitrate dehydrogenase [Tissierellia bacterium]